MQDRRTWEEKWVDDYFDEQFSFEESDDLWEDHPEDPFESWVEEMKEFSVGEVMVPDLVLMSKSLVPYEGTKPINLVAKQWACPQCLKTYNGSIQYVSEMQEYECSQCKLKNPSSYDWTLIRCKLNEVPLNFSMVYNQWGTDQCVLLAFIALCDMMRKVRGAQFGYDEGTKFDPNGMNWNYERFAHCRIGETSDIVLDMRRQLGPNRHPTIELLLIAACYYGVPYVANTRYDLQSYDHAGIRVPQRTLNVTSWFRVPGDDIDTITKLLAQGIPLLAVVPIGKLFVYLDEEDIYYAPEPEECITHAVVLHGSGISMPHGNLSKSELEVCQIFYRCRDSLGNKAHPSIEHKRKKGADFKIWARHIVGDVYGINIADLDN
ncbi:unnamed protein product [Urochloa humidicola]